MEFLISATGILIAIISLVISSLTYYNIYLRKGNIQMTQPTLISLSDIGGAKICLDFLLISTAIQGNVVENMYINLIQNNSSQIFRIWSLENPLRKSSGLFVSNLGCTHSHRFQININSKNFKFDSGSIILQIFACVYGSSQKLLLKEISLFLNFEEYASLSKGIPIIFTWEPDIKTYVSEILSAQ